MRRSTVLTRRRSSNPASSGGSDANIGCASHRSRNASTPSRSTPSASSSSAARRAARSSASAMPGDALTSTSRFTSSGWSSASCRQSRPPIEYPTYIAGPPASPIAAAVEAKSRPSGTSSTTASINGSALARRSIVGCHDAALCVNPGTNTNLTDAIFAWARAAPHEPGCSHLLRAHARRRVGPTRRDRRVPRTRLAVGAARARARGRRSRPAAHPPRRAIGVVLRPRARQGNRSPRGPAVHVGHRRGELPFRRARSPPFAGADRRVHRRSPARAARRRCRPDDRSDQALRRRGALVPRGRCARRRAGGRCAVAPARFPCGGRGAGIAERPGAPQPPVPRTAGADGRRARRRAGSRRRPSVDRDEPGRTVAVRPRARRARRTSSPTHHAGSWSRGGAPMSSHGRCCASPRSPVGRCSPTRSRACECRERCRRTTPSCAHPPSLRATAPTWSCASADRSPTGSRCSGSIPRSSRSWSTPTARGSIRSTW